MRKRRWIKTQCLKHVAWGALAFGVGLFATIAPAATWYVATNGSDAADGTSWSAALLTIKTGVTKAAGGGMVLVSNGTYAVTNFVTIGNNITVRGVNGYSNTLADGGGSSRLFSLDGTNANKGLINCTVVSNMARSYGGILLQSAGTMTNCISYYNTVTTGPYSNFYIVTGNAATGSLSYSCTAPLPAYGANNITAAPNFAAKEAGDFRLASGSPCIDSGSNMAWMATATELDSRSRLDRFRRQVDMGAYEFVPAGIMFMGR